MQKKKENSYKNKLEDPGNNNKYNDMLILLN